MTAANIQL